MAFLVRWFSGSIAWGKDTASVYIPAPALLMLPLLHAPCSGRSKVASPCETNKKSRSARSNHWTHLCVSTSTKLPLHRRHVWGQFSAEIFSACSLFILFGLIGIGSSHAKTASRISYNQESSRLLDSVARRSSQAQQQQKNHVDTLSAWSVYCWILPAWTSFSRCVEGNAPHMWLEGVCTMEKIAIFW